jgi:hypothetical protein
MSRFDEPLKYVRLPEFVVSLGLAALSLPCYEEAGEQRTLADSLKDTNPSQSEYIHSKAAFPEALGDTFAVTAALVFPCSLRIFRRREKDR